MHALKCLIVPLLLLLGACSAASPPEPREAVQEPAAAPAPVPGPTPPTGALPPAGAAAGATAPEPGEVDYSCSTDADCAVKDVGNCCGYYPACVNVDSPTFPVRVKARCQQEGMVSVCGFPAIESCVCRAGRCEAGPQSLPVE